ncbi:pilus assembly protein PilP [Pseudomonas sp.]|uniref:pilus assembly protein PilP n=1 Tax=Pseudomonas sp. TaxID=306 RepID=UPI0028AACA71|nr:pilus assembly protein PilP [Pseudomonas sp.]
MALPLDWPALATLHRALRAGLMIGVMLLIALGGYWARLYGLQVTIDQAHVEANQLGQRQAQIDTRLQHLAQERQRLDQAQARLQDARWRLAAGEEIGDLVERLTLAAHEHGLLFEQIGITPQPPADEYRRTLLQVRVRGAYPALRAWLDEWLAQRRVLHVRTLALTQAALVGRQVEAQFEVELFDPGEDIPVPRSVAHEPARGVTQTAARDLFAPWSAQPSGLDLAQVPLEQIEMVGSLLQGGRRHALLASAGRLYRVGIGDRLGRHEGRVVALEERHVQVHKRLYVGDAWQERSRTLSLRNVAARGKDDVEGKDEVGAGLAVGDR